ncbi:MAG: acetate--CoA ligase family protein [Phycisphaerales bacterium]|nr:acetate--CoA ligase family protein [Phycisphaerales bacterium]
MARLHEYQGKQLLAAAGLSIPRGRVANSPEQVFEIANELGGNVVVKVQAWVTGRKALGGVALVHSAQEAKESAEKMFSLQFGNFPVEELLVEELLDIKDEFFVSLTIDDANQAPLLLLDCQGGSGIEDRADTVARIPVTADGEISKETLLEVTKDEAVVDAIVKIVLAARTHEARSMEVNPLVRLTDGSIVAADCRVTIDDYAVFRHDDLGIGIARELDHPPTKLEQLAYEIEQEDHRGTFYFAKLPTSGWENTKGLIAFHGAGGGGSMMSMDAVSNEGFTLANFTDTSGNPSVAKVYQAARIILSQPNLSGYFGSGSGVASQEQYHSAYGLAKAFIEMKIEVPAVIRLGGNSEDRAVDILEDSCSNLPAQVRGFKKDDTPGKCAEVFAKLVEETSATNDSMARHVPDFVGSEDASSFPIKYGALWIDNVQPEVAEIVVRESNGLLTIGDSGQPEPTEDITDKDSDLIACEIECLRAGHNVVFVDMPVKGLD